MYVYNCIWFYMSSLIHDSWMLMLFIINHLGGRGDSLASENIDTDTSESSTTFTQGMYI